MEKTVRIDVHRNIEVDGTNNVGTVGENNATTLHFIIPTELQIYPTRELVFNSDDDSFIFQMNGDTFTIPFDLTKSTELKVQLNLKDSSGNVKWKTDVCELELFDSLNESGENWVDKAVRRVIGNSDELLDELNTDITGQAMVGGTIQGLTNSIYNSYYPAIEEAEEMYEEKTGSAYSGGIAPYNFADVIEDTYDKGNAVWNRIYEWAKTSSNFKMLFNCCDANHIGKFPYIKTMAVYDTNRLMDSNYVEECGYDLTNITRLATDMFGTTYNTKALKKLILTGFDKSNSATITPYYRNNRSAVFRSLTNLEELYVDKLCVKGYSSTDFFNVLFFDCTALETIGGANPETGEIDDNYGEIDFTSCTDTSSMFLNCYQLKNVKFTQNSLKISLSLAQSNNLTAESLLSLVNCLNSTVTGQSIIMYIAIRTHMKSLHCREENGIYVNIPAMVFVVGEHNEGEYITRGENIVYKCKETYTGDWDSSKWELQTNIYSYATTVSDLKGWDLS